MSTLIADIRAQAVNIDEDSLTVDLYDGRSLSVPLAWYPRLITQPQLSNGAGVGLEIEKEFTGRIWTKTSVFGIWYSASRPAKARNHSVGGSKRLNIANRHG